MLNPHLVDRADAFAAGPFGSRKGGMAVVVAPDMNAACAVLAADPAIKSGVFVAAIDAWIPRFRTNAPLPALE